MIPDTRRGRLVLAILLSGICGMFTVMVGGPRSDNDTSRPVSGLMQMGQIFRRPRLSRSPTQLGKNHELVKSAFREVIAEANEATVRILAGGKQVALGTVISPNGLVLTKSSELEGEIRVQVDRDRPYRARVVERLRNLDLALIEISDAPPLRAVSLQEATVEPTVGSWVAVPGGNSDIPLAIGVVSSPVRPIRSETALLGILLDDATQGARVRAVVSGSSAQEAGILEGDIVTRVGNELIAGSRQLIDIIRSHSAGDRVELKVRRPGDEQLRVVTATLGTLAIDDFEEREHTGGRLNNRRSGFAQVIQHDCPLSAHQCGGPLVNAQGQVIGINIAKAGRVETYALPIAIVKRKLGALAKVFRGSAGYASQAQPRPTNCSQIFADAWVRSRT